MAYTPTTWKDHLVPYPGRYIATPNADGTYTLIEDFGTPTQEGTPISAANMNKIEQGIADAHALAEGAETNAINWVKQFGLGAEAREATDLDDERENGWVAYTNTTLNRPDLTISGFGNAGIVMIFRDSVNRVSQLAFGMAGANTFRLAGRTYGAAGWGPWQQVWHSGNFDPSTKIDKSGGVSLGNFTIDSGALRFTDSGFTRNVLSTWGGDSTGIGIHLGGAGGGIAIGAGESGGLIVANNNPTSEHAYIGADQNVYLYSNMQNGWDVRKEAIWRNDGVLMLDGKRAMTRGDDPTGLIIPLLMPEVYYYTTNDSVDNTSVQNAEDTPLNLEDYKLLVNTDHFRGRSVYFEAIMSVASSGGLAVCRLVKPGQSGPQHIVEITTSSLTPTRVRSAVATLQNGDQLFIKFYSKSDNWQARLYAARLVIL